MIERWINNIIKTTEFSETTFNEEPVFVFSGDGCGDFEKTDNSASTETVLAYILECKQQIDIAYEYLLRAKHNV